MDNNNERIGWFFNLGVSRSNGDTATLTELCGFDPGLEGFDYAFEKGLTRQEDAGAIPQEDFAKTYWGIRPDFRFWAQEKRRQLIVEGKGRRPNNRSDVGQARRYLDYLRQFQADGALVYLVPNGFREAYLAMLCQAAEGFQIRFGAICWDEQRLNDDPVLSPIRM